MFGKDLLHLGLSRCPPDRFRAYPKITEGLTAENEEGETEAHVEPSSTSNDEGFTGVNEGDKFVESHEESPQCSNDPNPAIVAIDLGCNSSKSHQDSL